MAVAIEIEVGEIKRSGVAVPAGGKCGCNRIVSLSDHVGDVVGGVLDLLAVVGVARGEVLVADPLAVDAHLIDAAGGRVEGCALNLFVCGEFFAQHRDRAVGGIGVGENAAIDGNLTAVNRNALCVAEDAVGRAGILSKDLRLGLAVVLHRKIAEQRIARLSRDKPDVVEIGVKLSAVVRVEVERPVHLLSVDRETLHSFARNHNLKRMLLVPVFSIDHRLVHWNRGKRDICRVSRAVADAVHVDDRRGDAGVKQVGDVVFPVDEVIVVDAREQSRVIRAKHEPRLGAPLAQLHGVVHSVHRQRIRIEIELVRTNPLSSLPGTELLAHQSGRKLARL